MLRGPTPAAGRRAAGARSAADCRQSAPGRRAVLQAHSRHACRPVVVPPGCGCVLEPVAQWRRRGALGGGFCREGQDRNRTRPGRVWVAPWGPAL